MNEKRLSPCQPGEISRFQVGGSHYVDCNIQPWHLIEDWYPPDYKRGFLVGCILKRLQRHTRKGGIEDLEKAAHELAELIRFERTIAGLPDSATPTVTLPGSSTIR